MGMLGESNNGTYGTANIPVIPRVSTGDFLSRYDRLMRQGASSCREEPVVGSLAHLSVMDTNKPSAIAPVRALIYARASQDRLKLMRSISDQISDCRSWCQPLGWTVVRVLRDADRSASQWRTKDREGFEEALQLIESGRVDGFVTWEPSRAGRDLEIYLQLCAACQAAGVLPDSGPSL